MSAKEPWSKGVWIGLSIALLCYAGAYLFLYAGKDQQANRYRSTPLPDDYRFSFTQKFDEVNIPTPQAGLLNGLLFRVPKPKGVVCFWKGNGGTVANWGTMAHLRSYSTGMTSSWWIIGSTEKAKALFPWLTSTVMPKRFTIP